MEPSRDDVKPSRTAKLLYRPVGLVGSVVGGIVAGQIFRQVYRRAVPGNRTEAPKPRDAQSNWREVLVAAVIQGAIYAGVKALIDRGGARAFQKVFGEWPGE